MNMPRRIALVVLLLLSTALAADTVRLGTDVLPIAQTVMLTTDPRKDDYSGSTRVELEVKKATNAFRLHAEDLTMTAMVLKKGTRVIEATQAKGEDGTYVITAAEVLQPGRYELAVDFTNRFNRQAVGLYKMVTKDGEPYLFTQFQAIDARRAFPCWDEPGIKIPYELTVTIPELYDAVSNTPVAAESKSDGAKTIRFARTKPLPSYLIALAVGQFEYTPIAGMSVPGRIITTKGQGRLSKMAAEITPPLLAALETYFAGKHPFEKVDLIAVPEYWAGAMENPGAITFRDTILLLDPATATPAQRQNLIRVTAHELAHMWFGDLVTMEWWDDFWLNESFADWMADKITDQLYPEFGHSLGELQDLQQTMNSDARATIDPIRKRNSSPLDSIRNVGLAYNKGKAVLSMFESWIGAEKFRQGVLAHIKANAWGNANALEFFVSLGKHAPAGTSAAMETFIVQPGVPLLTAEVVGANEVRLTQTRFSTGEVATQTWRMPVTLRYSDGTTVRMAAVLLDAPSKTVKLEGARIDWLFPHANAAGYYRWRMPDAAMTSLAARAVDVLSPRERLAFIGNLGALLRSGAIHGDAYLDLLGRFAADPHPQVLSAALAALSTVRGTFVTGAENRPLYGAYIRRVVAPALDRIGLTPKEGEPHAVTVLRPDLLSTLALHADDERVWQFVREQFAKYRESPASVHPSLAGTVVYLSAARGDAALFEEFRKRFENAATPGERGRFLNALARFGDPELKKKAREYALTGPVRPNELFTLLGTPDSAADRDELFEWVTANYEAILKRMPPAFAGAMPFIAGGCEPERVTRAREFFSARKVEGTERRLAQVSEQVNECAALRARELTAVTGYLERR